MGKTHVVRSGYKSLARNINKKFPLNKQDSDAAYPPHLGGYNYWDKSGFES
jgi:hypothetical protein